MHTPMMTPADMYQEIVDQELADIFLDGDSLIVEDLTMNVAQIIMIMPSLLIRQCIICQLTKRPLIHLYLSGLGIMVGDQEKTQTNANQSRSFPTR